MKYVLTQRILALSLGATGVLSFALVDHIRQPQSTSIVRGRELAERMGCFGCHGPDGAGGYANPGSVEGEVPPLSAGGAFMFFVHDDQEIREWILDGRPARLEETERTGVIQMPAYRKVVTPMEIDDLVAFVRSVSHPRTPSDPLARQGYEISRELGCFACHGVHGRGSLPNPGSFKGIIPPWDSQDYEHLVNDRDELREWIVDGHIDRFEENPLARYFTHRQVIQMPAYGDRIELAELDALMAYVEWCRDGADSEPESCEVSPPPAPATSIVERGRFLYRSTGCATCHGAEGEGGIPNPNATGSFVPALDLTAERLELFEPEEIEAVVHALDQGADPAELDGIEGVEYFEDFLDAFETMRTLVLNGDLPTKRNPDERVPPMRMPAWSERMHADGGPTSKADVHAVIAYLLTLGSDA